MSTSSNTVVGMPLRGACEPAAVCAARRSLQLAKERLQQLEARDAASWEPFCILRNEMADLERKQEQARRALEAVRQRPYRHIPTGDLLRDNRAAAVFNAQRAADLEQAEGVLRQTGESLNERRARMRKFELERGAIAGALPAATAAIQRAQYALDAAVLAAALEDAAPALAQIAERLSDAELGALVRTALAPPAPLPPAAAA